MIPRKTLRSPGLVGAEDPTLESGDCRRVGLGNG